MPERQNYHDVENELKTLLADNSSVVAFLHGAWGCGKTTLVRDLFSAQANVLFVSLYGYKDIDEVKSALVLSWLTESRHSISEVKMLNPTTWAWPKRLWTFLETHVHGLSNWAKQRLIKRYSKALPAGFHGLLDQSDTSAIVFDDLERVSPEFDTASLWGFIDFIKEKTNIHLLIIGNEGALPTLDERASRRISSLEKTVDHQILLDPAPDWIADVSTRDFSFSEDILSEFSEFCQRTGSKNIRLFSRAARQLSRALTCLETHNVLEYCDQQQLARFYLALTHWKYDETMGLDWGDARKIIRPSEFPEAVIGDDGTPTRSYRMAQHYQLPEIPYGEILYEHIDSGILHEQALHERITYLVNHAAATQDIQSTANWKRVWETYHRSFDDDAGRLREELQELLEKESSLLTAETFEKLKELGDAAGLDIGRYKCDAYANSIQRAHPSELFNIREAYRNDDVLLRIVDDCIEHEFHNMSINDVARHAIDNGGWSRLHSKRIDAEPKENLLEWLKQPAGDKVQLVRKALQMEESGKLRQAIEELATASDLNEMRARHLYNISPRKEQERT